MFMKKLILIVTLITCAIATSTTYGRASERVNEGLYIGLFGGPNVLKLSDGFIWDDYIPNENKIKVKIDEKDYGFFGSAVIGYKSEGSLRIEGEISYRYNNFGSVDAERIDSESLEDLDDLNNVKIDVNLKSWCYMINMLYDINPCFDLNLYAGVGMGYDYPKIQMDAKDKITRNKISATDYSKRSFAMQLIAGVSKPIYSKTEIAFEYRMFNSFYRVIVFSNRVNHVYSFGIRRFF